MSRHEEEGPVEPVRCSLGDHELREDEVTTCLACINRARRVLREIEELYAQLPDAIRTLTGISYDRSGPVHGDGLPLPGGDALVMLAPGTLDGVRPSRRGDREHAKDQLPDDPQSVSAVLANLENDWRARRGDPAASYEPGVARCAEYLRRHMTWAAERHELFVEQRELLDWLHTRLEVVTGTSTRPVPVGAPCMHCGGRIVRRWKPGSKREDGTGEGSTRLGRQDEGLSDEMVCEGCGTTWEHDASYRLAQRGALEDLPSTSPDLKVTLADAKRIMKASGVRPNLLALWATRGGITPVGKDRRGQEVYRLGDIVERVSQASEAS